MIYSKEEAEKLLSKIISYSKADSVSVSLKGENTNNLRFALNTVSTCGASDSLSASITSNIGKKSGTVSINEFGENKIEEGVRKSEDIAILSPDNKEFMPPPGKQNSYPEVKEFFEDTDSITPDQIAGKISYTLDNAVKRDLTAFGFFRKYSAFDAIGNSKGLFAYHKYTSSNFSTTMRTKDSSGSSKIDRTFSDINLLDTVKFTNWVADRALMSVNPQKHEAGKFITILDSAAVADMIDNLFSYLDRRSSDEKRSFFTDKAKGNKIGQKVFSEKVNIYSDPMNKTAPSNPFTGEGIPTKKTEWITNGMLKNLYTSRYWAEKTSSPYVPYPVNLIMEGSNKSVEDLIASTENGIYVTRFWYIRQVDPKQILLTGLTRDGVFLIENGKIKHAINNFRFNESPVNVLNKIIDMSYPERVVGSETGDAKIVVPALKLSEFNFSTISDAI